VKYHHSAREDDIRDALAALDATRVEAGTTHILVFVWLCWTPEPPLGIQSSIRAPRKPAKKGLKKERGIKVKKEVKAEPEPMPKCPLAISSGAVYYEASKNASRLGH
jgi:hypothetical protein